jgi:6-pyruvoyltetrahydropterin/6-carboxytetrahydropterin synthase
MKVSTIELFKEAMKFSAGHFTIFSPTERENLHGHNFTISVYITAEIDPSYGMISDYGIYKRLIGQMCSTWNETFLLPMRSPHLRVEVDNDGNVNAEFNGERLHFLRRDVTLLPAVNITLEELARLFGEGLIDQADCLEKDKVQQLVVKCSSGPGQWASWTWSRA